MIFTHIFRYLDDRDAEETRRKNSDNSRPPAAEPRFHESSAEHRDVKFGQISWKATPARALGPGGRTPASNALLAQGFSTLRGDTISATATTKRVLPPIGKSLMSGPGEKQFKTCNDKNSAKLPPIEQLAGKTQANPTKSRACSEKVKESFWNNTSAHTRFPLKDQRCLGTNRAPLNTADAGQVKEMNQPNIENVTAYQLTRESPAHNCTETQRPTMRPVDDMSLVKAGAKMSYQLNAKMKLDSGTLKVGSAQTDAINAHERSNYKISRVQTRHKSSSDGEEPYTDEEEQSYSKNRKPNIIGDLHKTLGLNELNTNILRLSAKRRTETVKPRCYSTPCVQSEEVLRLKSRGAPSSSFVRSGKTTNNVQLVACDRGRRNAICEVIEKSIVPEFGSSLYEMRQSLMSIT